ncbi:distal tail protein Dit [Peribacillus frigoritolerans]|uniref:distal tail protein Dit n=1 Tax=Peribacillus frigoritolerans TaxID=450367 RepID=UPI003D2B3E0B
MKAFTFNGISKPYLTPLKGINRQPWAPIEWTFQEAIKRPGALLINKNTKVRTLSIPVFLKAESIEDLQKLKEDLAEWLIHDEPKPLIFDDEPDRIYYAVVDGSFEPDEILRWGQGVIPFVCPDPYKYGDEETIKLGGFPIRNEGTVEASPVFSVKFSTSAIQFVFTHENGKSVRIIYNFSVNDLLVVDMDKRKIIINNNVRMTTLDLNSTWFSLQPGNNVITVSSEATTMITFRPRWL